MRISKRLVPTMLVLLALAGCEQPTTSTAGDPRAQHLPGMKVKLGNRDFLLEVAKSDKEQEQGLMYRDPLPANQGMIFVFENEEERSFWMRNTKIPLDIIYTDRNGKIVAIKPMKPFDLSSVTSDKPAMYAIELNGGVAATTGLKVGDTVHIPKDISEAIRAAAMSGNSSTAPATRP